MLFHSLPCVCTACGLLHVMGFTFADVLEALDGLKSDFSFCEGAL